MKNLRNVWQKFCSDEAIVSWFVDMRQTCPTEDEEQPSKVNTGQTDHISYDNILGQQLVSL